MARSSPIQPLKPGTDSKKLQLIQLEPLDKTEDSRKLTIRYKVTASGSFHDIMTFVNQLERDDRYLKISDLDIGPEELFVSKATFTLSTYRFIQTKASAQS